MYVYMENLAWEKSGHIKIKVLARKRAGWQEQECGLEA